MRDGAGDAHLVVELRQASGMAGEILGQQLQRDGLSELEVVGAVDLAHAALAERCDDAEAAGEECSGFETPPARPAWGQVSARDRAETCGRVIREARHVVHEGSALVGFGVVDGELLQRGAGHPERRRLSRGLLSVPVIDDHPLDHPHRAGAVAGGAVDVRGFVALGGNRGDELVGDGRVGLLAVERMLK
jgi:hypothetical protein